MKKFLSKMPVMIVLLSLAAVGLVFYIVMLARPISYGMTYSYTQTVETEQDATESGLPIGSEAGMYIKFNSDSRAVVTMSAGENSMTTEMWVFRIGNKVVILNAVSEMTEEEYNQAVEAMKADVDTFNSNAIDINAFRMASDDGSENMTCNGAIVFAVVWAVVEIALIVFAVLSTLYYVKAKKNVSDDAATTAETTTDTQVSE